MTVGADKMDRLSEELQSNFLSALNMYRKNAIVFIVLFCSVLSIGLLGSILSDNSYLFTSRIKSGQYISMPPNLSLANLSETAQSDVEIFALRPHRLSAELVEGINEWNRMELIGILKDNGKDIDNLEPYQVSVQTSALGYILSTEGSQSDLSIHEQVHKAMIDFVFSRLKQKQMVTESRNNYIIELARQELNNIDFEYPGRLESLKDSSSKLGELVEKFSEDRLPNPVGSADNQLNSDDDSTNGIATLAINAVGKNELIAKEIINLKSMIERYDAQLPFTEEPQILDTAQIAPLSALVGPFLYWTFWIFGGLVVAFTLVPIWHFARQLDKPQGNMS